MFRDKVPDHLHIVEDEDNCCVEAIPKVAKRNKSECQKLKSDGSMYATCISMNTALAECSNSLLALLPAISPTLESTMQAATTGNIITSTFNAKATCLSVLGPKKKAR